MDIDRDSVMARLARKERGFTQDKAAKLLGISRPRVGQLFKKWQKKGGAPVQEQKPATVPASTQPAQDKPGAPLPRNLAELLSPVGGNGGETAPPVGASGDGGGGEVPPKDEPKPQEQRPQGSGGEGIDPEDASAGRELITWFRRGLTEFTCRFILGMKRDDPRLEEMRKENEFLRIAIKRNQEKAAPLGKLTKGFTGLGIGAVIEAVRAFFILGDTEVVPSKVTPCKVKEDEAPPAPAAEEKPTTNADEPEKPAKRMTLEEKERAAREAAGL